MYSAASQPSTIYAFVTQPIVAEGLVRILDSCPDLHFLGHSDDPSLVGEEIVRLRPNLLVVDYEYGVRVLFDLLEGLRRADSPTRVVVWSKALSAADRRQLFEAGARAVVEKTQPVNVLLECLRSVAAGELWTGVRDATTVEADQRVANRLTIRERQVLQALAEGLKNREIAVRLTITPGTVKVHLMHIFEKTGVRNRHELGMQAARLLEAFERREPKSVTSAPQVGAVGTGS